MPGRGTKPQLHRPAQFTEADLAVAEPVLEENSGRVARDERAVQVEEGADPRCGRRRKDVLDRARLRLGRGHTWNSICPGPTSFSNSSAINSARRAGSVTASASTL